MILVKMHLFGVLFLGVGGDLEGVFLVFFGGFGWVWRVRIFVFFFV